MTNDILQHLRIEKDRPGLKYLQGLISAYCTNVPWESISKIVKKSKCNNAEDCLRLEDEFWRESFAHGTGGTCYESNWAFYKLLQSLGFNCYLTINKIADKSSVHSAIIVTIDGYKYIADIGYPLYAPIPLLKDTLGLSNNQLINYRSSYLGSNEYLIENFPHPKPYLYHLVDVPVSERDYLNISIADYCETGLFLDRIIIRKIINSIPTRFDSHDYPYNIHQLQHGTKTKCNIETENMIKSLSDYFALDYKLIEQAFDVLKATPNFDVASSL